VVVGSISRGTWSVVTTERQDSSAFNGARRFAAGAEGCAAKLGSYGMSQRAREVARMVPGAWQSTWVDDSTAWAHARTRSAGMCARRGEQGLGALAARNLGSRRLHRWKGRGEAVFGQAGGPLPRETTRMRSLPGQKVGARRAEPEQVERDRSSAGVRGSVAMGRIPQEVGRGPGMPQTRPAGAVGAGCRSISDLIIWKSAP